MYIYKKKTMLGSSSDYYIIYMTQILAGELDMMLLLYMGKFELIYIQWKDCFG